MKKALWILACSVTAFSALATDSLILSGGKSAVQPDSYEATVKSLSAYILPAIFVIAGLVHLFYPRFGWWLKWGWQFKDPPEPSSLWLFGERFGGVVLIGIGIAILCGINFLKHS